MLTGSFWSPQGWEISRSDSYIHGHCALWIRCSVFLRQLKWSHEPLFHDNSNTTVSLTHTLALVISFSVPHTGDGNENTAIVCSIQHSHEFLWVVVTMPLKLIWPPIMILWIFLILHRNLKGTLFSSPERESWWLPYPAPRQGHGPTI